MDSKVNEFLNEIEGITPTKVATSDWQVCYDEKSGYSYYWNVKTDKVVWDKPPDFKPSKASGTGTIPPKPAPLFPSAASLAGDQFKVHNFPKSVSEPKPGLITNERGEKRTILLSSYSDHSDSDESDAAYRTVTMVKKETLQSTTQQTNSSVATATQNTKPTSASESDSNEEDDLLTKIQNRAKLLTQLGGEIPASVKKIVDHNGCNESANDNIRKQTRKNVSGFSLVAGYSDSDEDDTPLPPTKPEIKAVSSSALFPTPQPIDLGQFSEVKKDVAIPLQNIDTKPFQKRRKRIAIEITDVRKPENLTKSKDESRLGFGFKSEEPAKTVEPKANYPGFKSGGLMFVKPNHNQASEKKNMLFKTKQKIDNTKKYSPEDMKKIEDAHKSVSEKLNFLAEGHATATPMQTMIIQLETLYDAMKANSLSVDYLYKWLQDTYTELAKLEKGAAPVGWVLKWDRIVKRYYYRNQQSGDCQWEYPQPDIVGGDEAMDISTTPPPTSVFEEPQLPSPPLVESLEPVVFSVNPPPPPLLTMPPPPPPPTISEDGTKKPKGKGSNKRQRLMPKKSRSVKEEFLDSGEPLPPGVDLISSPPPPPPEVHVVPVLPEEDALGSALNSFYSDLASMESYAPIPQPILTTPAIQEPVLPPNIPEKIVKKKKTKVKIVEGLAMKKKGVSKLVEKWKNVQKDY